MVWLARRLRCFVIVGYPERVDIPDGPSLYYNSACILDRCGQLIHTYRKAYLFTTDLNWASWSDKGFTTVLFDGIGEVSTNYYSYYVCIFRYLCVC
jgi:predicted amidohydrolase